MKIIETKSEKEMSQLVSQIIIQEIIRKPDMKIAIPTGSTPIGTLEEIVRIFKEGYLDFSQLKCFQIDEYIGLDKTHPQSYYYFLNNYLYKHTNIQKEHIFYPNVFNNLEEACQNYEDIICKNGYFDFILLGIGEDGHIGFNEPTSLHDSNCHIVQLNESTIRANSKFFKSHEEVPTRALTLGMGTILKSRKIVLIASGDKKAKVIHKLLSTDKVDPFFPASFLLLHSNVTIIYDENTCMI